MATDAAQVSQTGLRSQKRWKKTRIIQWSFRSSE